MNAKTRVPSPPILSARCMTWVRDPARPSKPLKRLLRLARCQRGRRRRRCVRSKPVAIADADTEGGVNFTHSTHPFDHRRHHPFVLMRLKA
jgi:hypothetical protein